MGVLPAVFSDSLGRRRFAVRAEVLIYSLQIIFKVSLRAHFCCARSAKKRTVICVNYGLDPGPEAVDADGGVIGAAVGSAICCLCWPAGSW